MVGKEKVPRAQEYKIGDRVLLHTARHPQLRPNKLHPRFAGPFVIKRVQSASNVELELPPSSRAHPVVNTDSIKHFHEEQSSHETTPPPAAATAQPAPVGGGKRTRPQRGQLQDGTFKVEKLVRMSTDKARVLVHWVGYGVKDRTWEPYESVKHLTDLLQSCPVDSD